MMHLPSFPGRVAAVWRHPLAAACVSKLLEAVIPPLCLGCRRPLSEAQSLCPRCWSALEIIAPPICPILGTPLSYDAGPGAHSPELRWNHPLYERARAGVVYGPMSRRLVHQLKFQDVPGVAPLMARLMLPRVAEIIKDADLLLPVPLHRRRLAARRFNQAVILADRLSEATGVPVIRFAVRRVRSTRHQVGLTREQRADNLNGAFRVVDRDAIAGRTVVMVDDVITTGATADALAMALTAAGARTVRMAAFARVVGSDREPV